MKFCLTIVLALVAIACGGKLPSLNKYGGRLPLPLALQDKWDFLMKDDPIIDGKVVNGVACAANVGNFQCALFRGTSFTCGCSVISGWTFLTAAHCIDGSENRPDLFTVKCGMKNINDPNAISRSIAAIIKHPSYSSSTVNNDAALMIADTSIPVGSNIQIIPLAKEGTDPPDGALACLFGWGRLTGGGSLPTALQCATLTHVDRNTCQNRWGSNSITAQMTCCHANTTSACNGDSGGCLANSAGEQVGIVSWGSSACLHGTLPNVYCNVGHPDIRGWIDKNIKV